MAYAVEYRYQARKSVKENHIALLLASAILIITVLAIGKAILGKEAWAQMVGQLAADAVRALFLLPFRVLRFVINLFR